VHDESHSEVLQNSLLALFDRISVISAEMQQFDDWELIPQLTTDLTPCVCRGPISGPPHGSFTPVNHRARFQDPFNLINLKSGILRDRSSLLRIYSSATMAAQGLLRVYSGTIMAAHVVLRVCSGRIMAAHALLRVYSSTIMAAHALLRHHLVSSCLLKVTIIVLCCIPTLCTSRRPRTDPS
jgi:hypothetical protein